MYRVSACASGECLRMCRKYRIIIDLSILRSTHILRPLWLPPETGGGLSWGLERL